MKRLALVLALTASLAACTGATGTSPRDYGNCDYPGQSVQCRGLNTG